MELIFYIPIITTFLAVFFGTEVAMRYHQRKGLHLLWWSVGIFLFGLGTLVESFVAIWGWNSIFFRLWYIAGALLGAAPLAQGTIYLLMKKRTAHILTSILFVVTSSAIICIFLTPLNYDVVENHRLSSNVISWKWTRNFSILLNVYAVFFLGGGALFSAWHFYRQGRALYHRFLGNILIFSGTICAATGGTFARMGKTEVLYIAEFIALILIYLGYRKNISEIAIDKE